jgi:hypothetical protein
MVAAGEIGESQCENRPTKKEGWTPSKQEKKFPVPESAKAIFSYDGHRSHNTVPEKGNFDPLINYSR